MQLNEIFNWINSTSKAEDSDFIRRALVLVAIHHAAKLPNSIEQAEQIREKSKSQLPNKKKSSESLVNKVNRDELPKPLSGLPSQLFERLGNIATINKGLTPIQKATPGAYPLVVTAKERLSSSTYDFDTPAAIIPTVSSTGHGDASLKRIHYQEGKYAVGSILAVVQPKLPELISARFIYEYLSVFKDELLVSRMVGTANVSLTINKIMEVPIPLVSGSIIDELPELMALCDQLEQQHSNAQEAHETLVSQLLATLTQSQNAAEFNANWQRIYAHFDALFTTEASIDALKQTLLQLAVMGKLVPQDPNDEPASELLKRIQGESVKTNLVWLDFNGLEEIKKGIPSNWAWVRLGEIADIVRGGSPRPAGDLKFYDGNIPFLKVGDVTRSKGKMVDGFTSTIKPAGLIKTRFINTRTVLLTNSGATLGVPAICDFETTFNDGIAAFINLSSEVFDEYLYLYLKSISAWFLNVAAQGQGQPNLNTDIIRSTWIPVTSLQEQHRIVAKVDALMALCDQLKIGIQQANQQQQAIADALVAQALKPATAEIIDLTAYRAAITCNIIKRMQHNHSFGRTFAMKLLYLSQQHIGFETHLEFEREAAGPFDKWIYDFERDGVAAGWFLLVEKQLSNGYKKIEYQVQSAIDESIAQINTVGSKEQRNELDRLLALFADKKTEEAEIAATLFAAWNDFLLNGVSPTDEQIIQEVRENWHSSKERFSPKQLTKWLNWLRGNNIVPTGKGSKTIYQKNLLH